ncbi:cytochrome P450 [Hymenopellis radicata]|nr:cytochrome P450 [Hymenopellis radicata]
MSNFLDSAIIGNAWLGILHNEDTYPDAHAYNPERFIGTNPQRDPTKIAAFGFGRRICAGRHFAMDTNFIAVASLLWAFTFTPEKDENGAEIMPDQTGYADGIVAFSSAFKCKITPRFEEVESIVGPVN